jgi:hypothetical protein
MMKKRFVIVLIFLNVPLITKAQTKINVQDISNFWQAYDSVKTTSDKTMQLAFIEKIYLGTNTEGIKYLKAMEGHTASDFLSFMTNAKEKLESIRPFTMSAIDQKPEIDEKLRYFKKIYPSFVDGEVFFIIGTGIFGGRPRGRNLVIGTEVVATDKADYAVNMVLHEYVHCQQKLQNTALLSQTILEGMADFVAELVDQKPLALKFPDSHNAFGLKNEKAIWKEYKKFMGSEKFGETFDWLYGSKGRNINGIMMRDLGYYMGYAFCRSYYQNAIDKTAALSEMIKYDFSSNEKAKEFLIKSGYGNAKDQAFIKNLKFAPVIESKKKIVYREVGFEIKNGLVNFKFEAPKGIDINSIETVTLAGSFNGWNPANKAFDMKKDGNSFVFSIPINSLEKGVIHEFKFVINHAQWQNIPENAKNTKEGNLTFKID